MSETERNEPPIPEQGTGDDGEDYGAKGGDEGDQPEAEPEDLKFLRPTKAARLR